MSRSFQVRGVVRRYFHVGEYQVELRPGKCWRMPKITVSLDPAWEEIESWQTLRMQQIGVRFARRLLRYPWSPKIKVALNFRFTKAPTTIHMSYIQEPKVEVWVQTDTKETPCPTK